MQGGAQLHFPSPGPHTASSVLAHPEHSTSVLFPQQPSSSDLKGFASQSAHMSPSINSFIANQRKLDKHELIQAPSPPEAQLVPGSLLQPVRLFSLVPSLVMGIGVKHTLSPSYLASKLQGALESILNSTS